MSSTTSAGLMLQRMRGLGEIVPAGGDPIVAVNPTTAEVTEGELAEFIVSRAGGDARTPVNVTYAFASEGGTADFAEATTGALALGANVYEAPLSILTTKRAGTQGSRQIRATLTGVDDGSIAPGKNIAVMLLNDMVEPIPGLPKYVTLPTPAKQRCVGFTGPAGAINYPAGRAGLDQAVAAWVPGDVIRLADGTYAGGKLTITRGGTKDNHVVLMARNHLKAVINFQLDVDAEYVWLNGLKLPYSGTFTPIDAYYLQANSVLIRRKGFRATNCKCTSQSFAMMVYDPNKLLSDIQITYNNLECVTQPNVGDTAIIAVYSYPAPASAPKDVNIAYNIVTQLGKAVAGASGDQAARRFINLQPSKPNANVAVERTFRVHHNHIRGYFREISYTKRNVYFGYNYCEWISDATKDYITQRHGLLTGSNYDIGGLIEGNLFNMTSSNGLEMEINGVGNTIIGNKLINGKGTIRLKAGQKPTGNDTVGLYDAASYASVVENVGFQEVVVGEFSQNNILDTTRGGFPTNVRIYRGASNWNPIITRDKDFNGLQTPASSYTLLTGYGPYTAVTPITEAELLAVCGCDPE